MWRRSSLKATARRVLSSSASGRWRNMHRRRLAKAVVPESAERPLSGTPWRIRALLLFPNASGHKLHEWVAPPTAGQGQHQIYARKMSCPLVKPRSVSDQGWPFRTFPHDFVGLTMRGARCPGRCAIAPGWLVCAMTAEEGMRPPGKCIEAPSAAAATANGEIASVCSAPWSVARQNRWIKGCAVCSLGRTAKEEKSAAYCYCIAVTVLLGRWLTRPQLR